MTDVAADLRGDRRAPVAALGAVALVAQADHQRLPCPGDPADAPARRGRLAGEAVAGQRRADHVKGVLGAPAVCGRVGQRPDHLVELDDRSRPAVRDDEREGVAVWGPLMDEMDVEAVDLGGELVEAVQRGFACPPVVFVAQYRRARGCRPAECPDSSRRRIRPRASGCWRVGTAGRRDRRRERRMRNGLIEAITRRYGSSCDRSSTPRNDLDCDATSRWYTAKYNRTHTNPEVPTLVARCPRSIRLR